MHIATVSLGDSLVTLHRVWRFHASAAEIQNPSEQDTYVLTFTDMPTGAVHRLSVVGENKAVLMLAAWIAADEQTGWDTPLIEEMRRDENLRGVHMP